jgi:hypothetical protein
MLFVGEILERFLRGVFYFASLAILATMHSLQAIAQELRQFSIEACEALSNLTAKLRRLFLGH